MECRQDLKMYQTILSKKFTSGQKAIIWYHPARNYTFLLPYSTLQCALPKDSPGPGVAQM